MTVIFGQLTALPLEAKRLQGIQRFSCGYCLKTSCELLQVWKADGDSLVLRLKFENIRSESRASAIAIVKSEVLKDLEVGSREVGSFWKDER